MIRGPNTIYQPLIFSSCNRKDDLIKGGTKAATNLRLAGPESNSVLL